MSVQFLHLLHSFIPPVSLLVYLCWCASIFWSDLDLHSAHQPTAYQPWLSSHSEPDCCFCHVVAILRRKLHLQSISSFPVLLFLLSVLLVDACLSFMPQNPDPLSSNISLLVHVLAMVSMVSSTGNCKWKWTECWQFVGGYQERHSSSDCLQESKYCPPLSAAKRPHYLELDLCDSRHLVHIQEGNKHMKDDMHHLLNPFGLICTVLQATVKILWGCPYHSGPQKAVVISENNPWLHHWNGTFISVSTPHMSLTWALRQPFANLPHTRSSKAELQSAWAPIKPVGCCLVSLSHTALDPETLDRRTPPLVVLVTEHPTLYRCWQIVVAVS